MSVAFDHGIPCSTDVLLCKRSAQADYAIKIDEHKTASKHQEQDEGAVSGAMESDSHVTPRKHQVQRTESAEDSECVSAGETYCKDYCGTP